MHSFVVRSGHYMSLQLAAIIILSLIEKGQLTVQVQGMHAINNLFLPLPNDYKKKEPPLV